MPADDATVDIDSHDNGGTNAIEARVIVNRADIEALKEGQRGLHADLAAVKSAIEDKHGTLVDLLTTRGGAETVGGTVVLQSAELCHKVVDGGFDVAKGKTGFTLALAALIAVLTGSGLAVKNEWLEIGPAIINAEATSDAARDTEGPTGLENQPNMPEDPAED